MAHGWRTGLWAAARVADLMERHFGIAFHPKHVRKVLEWKFGWTRQKPQKWARERDEVAIDHRRRQELPKILARARRRKAYLVFLDASG